MTRQSPDRPAGWKTLGRFLLEEANAAEAREALARALALAPDDPEALTLLGQAELALGNPQEARRLLQRSLALDDRLLETHYRLAVVLHDLGHFQEALQHAEQGFTLFPGQLALLERKALALMALHRYDEAIDAFDKLIELDPKNYSHWNNAGNLCRDIGLFDKADTYLRRAMALSKHSDSPLCNRLTALHYNPAARREAIFEVCKEWEARFAPRQVPSRPQPEDLSPRRRLRIGMFSDGFRNHPVGRMITSALEHLPRHEFELFAYSTSSNEDQLTRRIKQVVDHWSLIQHMTDEQFAERVREDRIDILIDLCGYNAGSRMRTMAMQPAPLLMKWVGGLINTTGLSTIDYLLTDAIESPAGEDAFYTEKLIRMPDDYICYAPPEYMPDVSPLPALENGYITLGCFNNPSKINEVLLGEWARLMHQLPDSRLLLKGFQYNSEKLCQRVRAIMAELGIIDESRLLIEGPSPHQELLRTYNRVDIALDPWPYSGGLTTCEAFLMGVPVVTLPGPTFAGRHSATHLVNAGMPELVTHSWDEYRQRVIELAGDLQSLAVIRTHLRDVLLKSPVCDGPRFAKHLTAALRAIWQRYCEGKQPAALALDKEGQAWFEGDSQPMQLQHPEPGPQEDDFSFSFEGKVITLDHGGALVGSEKFANLQKLGAFATVAFDPASKVNNATLAQSGGELHHYPHIALGDGQETTLYACLDPAMTATLEPLPAERQLPDNRQATQIIVKLPIATLRLDDIEGLESIDWLLLDNLNDSLKVLENGEKALANTLLVQARVNFVPTHEHQPELTLISHWLSRHGFSFYRLNNQQHYSHLPKRDDLVQSQATQLTCADALFIPNEDRMAELTDNQRLKLAFVLHTVYGIKDLAYSLIAKKDRQHADNYLDSSSARAVSSPQQGALPLRKL